MSLWLAVPLCGLGTVIYCSAKLIVQEYLHHRWK